MAPSQLLKCAPAALPTGTLPVAIAPTIVPSAKGVRIEDTANNPSISDLLAGAESSGAQRVRGAAQ